ncbi:hypothetical protein PYW08_012484 [Mythimna loreyi]|uniref:Uncharacterized protein n=1 Tax=Mythimna loreyi TaxID=667449 RepID=A0ACC2Q099_9NEOP|nr:hypothetical protein PYW08_012484 [Mythimna loreyi]
MILRVLILFVSAVFCQFQFEGDLCYKDGAEGVCISFRQCKRAQEDRKNRKNPQICSNENNNPIVCCVGWKPEMPENPVIPQNPVKTENPERPPRPTRPPVQENLEDQCEQLPEEYTPAKTGQKAFDKCIDYQQKYVYPCGRGVDILGSVSRQSHCHHVTNELISGGTDAALYEFPHMAILGYGPLESLEFLCGGAVISEKFILTAGHCISSGRDYPVTYVAIGVLRRTDAKDQSKLYKVKNIIPHPHYKSPNRYNDIALLETEKVMALDQFTVPACLHVGAVNDTKVLAAGWGLTQENGKPSDSLMRVVLTKFEEWECAQKYQPFRLMTRGFEDLTQSCYGDRDPPKKYEGREEYKDTCKGDSGGPIQIKDQRIHCMYTIVGVTSVGKGSCGNSHQPAVYTRVAQFLPWIENIVWPN